MISRVPAVPRTRPGQRLAQCNSALGLALGYTVAIVRLWEVRKAEDRRMHRSLLFVFLLLLSCATCAQTPLRIPGTKAPPNPAAEGDAQKVPDPGDLPDSFFEESKRVDPDDPDYDALSEPGIEKPKPPSEADLEAMLAALKERTSDEDD